MPTSKTVVINPDHKDMHAAIGRAIEAYAKVESAQTWLLGSALGIDRERASAIFHSAQNVRGRNAMLQALLSLTYDDRYRAFWASCSKFLSKLADFRNAIVHGHPETIVFLYEEDPVVSHYLVNPSGGRTGYEIRPSDIPAFVKDCRIIEGTIGTFANHLAETESDLASRGRFRKPITHQNQAVLQRLQKPTKPRRQP